MKTKNLKGAHISEFLIMGLQFLLLLLLLLLLQVRPENNIIIIS